MDFNKHFDLVGKHAFLGASKYHWINYSEDKLVESWTKAMAVARGTQYHELAAMLIRMGEKLPRSKKTLNMYVNDAIGYRMAPEQPLYFSENCFGTADAISFRKGLLRIHDLKTGVTPTHIEQLIVYAALFCLEYHTKPAEIGIELRIYQNDEILIHEPEVDEILPVMDKIVSFDKIIRRLRTEFE